MILTPSTEVRLLKGVPFVKGSGHVRLFNSAEEQRVYFFNFDGKEIATTYNNKDEALRVDGVVEQYYGYNYLMFKNNNIEGRWIFAFIDDITLLSNGTTGIHYTVDAFQTFMFDLSYKDSYVEREHSRESVINTQDEGIAYGDTYRCTDVKRYYPYPNNGNITDIRFALLIAKENLIESSGLDSDSHSMTGIDQPLHYYLIPFYSKVERGQSWDGVNALVNGESTSPLGYVMKFLSESEDHVGSVVALHLIDYVPLELGLSFQETGQDTRELNVTSTKLVVQGSVLGSLKLAKIISNRAIEQTVVEVDKLNSVPAYAWNKLKQYPYTYIEITDNQGSSIKIDPLHLSTNMLKIVARGNISPQHKSVYTVQNYKGLANDISNALINNTITTLPILSDELAAYIRSSSNSDRMAIATGVAQMGIATATLNTGAMGGQTFNTLTNVMSLQAKKKDIDNRPPSISAQGNNATYDFGNNNIGLFVKWWTITDEYATIISQYFNKFGYAINRSKVPNLKTHRSWNYVKTIDAMIFASIPQNFLEEIKEQFNNGVTLWHVNDIGNYSLNNEEV